MSQKFLFVDEVTLKTTMSEAFESGDFVSASTGAADAGAPVVLDGSGLLDLSFLPQASIDHGTIAGLTDDDHPQYTLADGTRAFTGDQSMGGFVLTNLGTAVNGGDAVSKELLDAYALGIPRVKGNVAVATIANISLSAAPASIDGYTLVADDRVLVKDQTTATENGIYVFNGTGAVMTRAEDADNSPSYEIYNGTLVPYVMNGTTNIGTRWIVTSVGSGDNSTHILGTDAITFSDWGEISDLSGGDGIDITANVVSVDLLTDGGLEFSSGELGIDFASSFDGTENKAIAASDLQGTSGASYIGALDAGSYFVSDTVEGQLQEIGSQLGSVGVTMTAGAGISLGALVYPSANDTVLTVDPSDDSHEGIGIAASTVGAAADVNVLQNGSVLPGALSGATAGTIYYWNGSALVVASTSLITANKTLWKAGVALNATDLLVDVQKGAKFI